MAVTVCTMWIAVAASSGPGGAGMLRRALLGGSHGLASQLLALVEGSWLGTAWTSSLLLLTVLRLTARPIWPSQALTLRHRSTSQGREVVAGADHRAAAWPVAVSNAHVPWGWPCCWLGSCGHPVCPLPCCPSWEPTCPEGGNQTPEPRLCLRASERESSF